MNWQPILDLYRSELRAAFRERHIVINTILLPALLYPVILWVLFNGLLFIQGQNEGQRSRVALEGSVPAELEARFEDDSDLEIVLLERSTDEALDADSVHVVVEVQPAKGPIEADLEITVSYDSSREHSSFAQRRVIGILQKYRKERLEAIALDWISADEWAGFRVETENVASGDQMGAMILGLLLPLYFVIMVAMGCMVPAVDSTAGERERNTWETTMTLALSRVGVVTAKYLYVTTMGFLAGALNLAAMTLTMRSVLEPLLANEGVELSFRVPLAAIPLLLAGSLVLAGSIAAAMMIFAVFARTFKEGQAMVTPIYIATFLPVLFLTREGLELTTGLAFLPVVNVAMMVREAIRGSFPVLPIVVVMVTQAVVIALLLRLAAVILRAEDVLTGSYEGNLIGFLRRRRRRKAVAS